MTDSELKTLKDNLWHSADILRAGVHLAANRYDRQIFADKTTLLFRHFVDMAVQGYGWIVA